MSEINPDNHEPFRASYREFWIADFPEGISFAAREYLEEEHDFRFGWYNKPEEYVVGFCFIDESVSLKDNNVGHLYFKVTRQLDERHKTLPGVRITLHKLEHEPDEFIDYDIGENAAKLEPIFESLARVKAGEFDSVR